MAEAVAEESTLAMHGDDGKYAWGGSCLLDTETDVIEERKSRRFRLR